MYYDCTHHDVTLHRGIRLALHFRYVEEPYNNTTKVNAAILSSPCVRNSP